jgi:hypothetical protein
MRNIIITTIALCMNILTLFFIFKTSKNIKNITRNMQEQISLLGKKNYEITEDLEDVKRVASKLNVKIVIGIVRENDIDYEELEKRTDLRGNVLCVVFKDITCKEKLFNPLQMCLEELAEEGYKYKLVDENLEITI